MVEWTMVDEPDPEDDSEQRWVVLSCYVCNARYVCKLAHSMKMIRLDKILSISGAMLVYKRTLRNKRYKDQFRLFQRFCSG